MTRKKDRNKEREKERKKEWKEEGKLKKKFNNSKFDLFYILILCIGAYHFALSY